MNLNWLYRLYAWAIGYLVAVIVALGVIAALGDYVVWLVVVVVLLIARRHRVVVHALVRLLPLAIGAVVNSTIDEVNGSIHNREHYYIDAVNDNEGGDT